MKKEIDLLSGKNKKLAGQVQVLVKVKKKRNTSTCFSVGDSLKFVAEMNRLSRNSNLTQKIRPPLRKLHWPQPGKKRKLHQVLHSVLRVESTAINGVTIVLFFCNVAFFLRSAKAEVLEEEATTQRLAAEKAEADRIGGRRREQKGADDRGAENIAETHLWSLCRVWVAGIRRSPDEPAPGFVLQSESLYKR